MDGLMVRSHQLLLKRLINFTNDVYLQNRLKTKSLKEPQASFQKDKFTIKHKSAKHMIEFRAETLSENVFFIERKKASVEAW